MEKVRPTETIIHSAAVGLVALALSACNGAVTLDEEHIWYSSETKNDPVVQKHENSHVRQMKAVGGAVVFWQRYFTEPGFDCKAEIDAGLDDPSTHPVCVDDDWKSWNTDDIHRIFQNK